ncbi:MAG: hypothetical protein NT018_05320, partial [Armatimonadetes bacterium]|nr:hypothetical protein [Armatimonadota bacterium]
YQIMADWDWVHQSIAVEARWKHIDLIVCYYDCNGISSNQTKMQDDYMKILHLRYSFWKRVCYSVAWKPIRRLRRWYVSNIFNRKDQPNA